MSDMKRDCKTMSIPEAGALYFGLSRNGSYQAAERGDIPTIRVGRKLRVPVAAMERLLDNVKLNPAA
jgi:excisionase family DNA binding protein